MELNTLYKQYKVTNGQFRPIGAEGTPGTAMELGCTGALEAEPEMKTLSMRCEGDIVDEISKPEFYTVNFTGHLTLGVAREIFGLTNDGLKDGVYAIGDKSVPKKGVFTWEVYDMYNEGKKFMAFSNMVSTTGWVFSHENGADEVAEIEVEFKAMKDDKGNFYYEAFESEITDEEVKTGWLKLFTTELVAGPVTP